MGNVNAARVVDVNIEEMNTWTVSEIASWCEKNQMEIEIDRGRIVGVRSR